MQHHCLSRRNFLKRISLNAIGVGVATSRVARADGEKSSEAIYKLAQKNERRAAESEKIDAATQATPPGSAVVSIASSLGKDESSVRRRKRDGGALRIEGFTPQPLSTSLSFQQIEKIVRRAILDLDNSRKDLRNVIQSGDWVVVKPNIVTCYGLPFSRYECHGQVTDLRVVKILIDILMAQGKARKVTIAEGGGDWYKLGEKNADSDQKFDGWTVRWPEFDDLSYIDIAKGANRRRPGFVDIVDLDTDHYTFVPTPGGGLSANEYAIPNTILNCDKLISVAALKTNNYAGVTLALKNYIGVAPSSVYSYNGISKEELPHDEISEVIADLFSYHPADYAIIEGFRGMEGYGPIYGDELVHNVVIAGGDPVACDSVGAAVMGFNPWDIGALHNAAKNVGGVNDLHKIYVRGDSIASVSRRFAKSPKEHPVEKFSSDEYYGRGNREWLINGWRDGRGKERNGLDYDFLRLSGAAEPNIAPNEGQESAGKKWTKLSVNKQDYVDLKKHFDYKARNCVAYAFAYIKSDAAKSCHLRIGNEKAAKLWLNGELVLRDAGQARFSYLQHQVKVKLKRGVNRLLVKVANNVGSYGFSVALADEDGDTPFGVEYTTRV